MDLSITELDCTFSAAWSFTLSQFSASNIFDPSKIQIFSLKQLTNCQNSILTKVVLSNDMMLKTAYISSILELFATLCGCIYCDAPSARTGRLIPVWKPPSDGRLHTAASREKKPSSHSRLHTAVSRGIKCLSHTYSETAISRPPTHGHSMVYRTTASQPACKQPPGGLKNTYPGTAVSQPFPNGCLAVNSSRSYLAGGTILAMYQGEDISY